MDEDQDNQRFRLALIAQRESLQQVADSAREQSDTVELDQSRVGRLSRMDAMQAQAMAVASERRREQQLLRIEAALGRLNADEYGFCLRCGEDIDPGRLDFDPAATLCIRCATQVDDR